jgi:multiple sugar transport system permease protein
VWQLGKAIKQYAQVSPWLLPGLILAAVFIFYPMAKGIHMSFYQYNLLSPEKSDFVGWDHFARALRDSKYYLALRNTALFTLVTVPGQWILGVVTAMLINLHFIRFKVGFRLIYYIPVISSWVVVSYLFGFMFSDGPDGVINYLLTDVLHILNEPVSWLQNTWTANVVIWAVSVWKGIGWVMVMYLAALQSIPHSLYEAAEIDGARGVKTFLYITLPLMKPMTMFVIINLINGAFQAFIQVFLITNGGPLGSTEVLNTYMFKQAFKFLDFGYASSISILMGLMIFVLTYSQQRTFGRDKIEY